MSRNGEATLDFADGKHRFRIGFRELIMLQEKRDCGPMEVYSRLQNGLWRVEDITEVIRFGLIGGGMTPVAASKMVRNYVEERPPMENLATAIIVIAAALLGAQDEPPGELGAANRGPNGSMTSQTGSSGLPLSMA